MSSHMHISSTLRNNHLPPSISAAPHFIQEEKEHKESRHATAKKATSATEEITEAASAHSSANQTSASLSTSTQGIRSELIQRQGTTLQLH